ncbi:MAG TPA: hemolysin family protein [Longimicrobiales bacterium]|nr:hemolysin family protein [Longimicrobiales bacterium]
MQTHATISIGEAFIRLAIVMLLVAANGFFVTAEFALVGARRTRIEELARKGNRGARLVQQEFSDLNLYLSATQLGITLASLGLGWVAESTVAILLIQWFDAFAAPWNLIATHTVSGVLAFAFITFMHIVLGEQAPKVLALTMPERAALWTAGPLFVFARVFAPFIWALNAASNLTLRSVGLKAAAEAERVHRPEEIEMLVTQSYEHGLLAEEPVEMIRGVFDLSETIAAEVMTPRTDVVAVPDTATLDQVADVVVEQGHSRVPVYHENIDHIVGVVLARDVWRAQRDGKPPLEELVRPVPFVPETKSVEDLLREMQAQRIHMAVVVDEFGGTAGVVTLEDLVEEIVGEITDEDEAGRPPIEELPSGDLLVDGGVPVWELNEGFDLHIPEGDYTTVAGYILDQLGRIAEKDDVVTFPGGRMSVVDMAGRRIERVLISRTAKRPPEAEAD